MILQEGCEKEFYRLMANLGFFVYGKWLASNKNFQVWCQRSVKEVVKSLLLNYSLVNLDGKELSFLYMSLGCFGFVYYDLSKVLDLI